ncbi:cyclic-di-AMP phosphodiesterase PdeA [Listeria seeligeri]|nr:cyclic-di-AMP phosphodiesterase PdeA [Listeria seeligeri]MBC1833115.1 cyclic-di-AMP phosphodiesterase PdeA [Listeria seeligeri]MBC1869286.1 cyclic-di-AMP phosphodiesterase PdeA [Listeria seeligeri]MBC1899788.1 cyclic-di-AMP phosphodiesterase PdeA [Listeria seeligeri]MBC2094270.1 cyclic-di-AMP phosphodiesterase PdeA [Listeria seeligeri]MBC6132393.1 cyclic-di-AMP phosphodiesterase PdeA [Listeria seeligeri]
MSGYFQKRMLKYPLYGLIAATVILSVITFFFSWWLSVLVVVGGIILTVAMFYFEYRLNEDVQKYVSNLTYRIKRSEEEALVEMPMGILLYDEHYKIEWVNPFMSKYFDKAELIGESLEEVGPEFLDVITGNDDDGIMSIAWREHRFDTIVKRKERILYLYDRTEYYELNKKFQANKSVFGVIFLDNYDEWAQGMDDRRRSALNNLVTSMLTNWAREHRIYLKRISTDRFMAFLTEEMLKRLEEEKFQILDRIRERTSKQNIPLTLSIGIGYKEEDLIALADLAQSSLDLALGRGGDQVVIKQPEGKVRFYGGKTNPMEKRTRVRARVISQALQELITQSDQVFVMGHRYPDMDVIGSSLGVMRIAEMNDRNAYVVVEPGKMSPDVKRLMNEIEEYPNVIKNIVTPQVALENITEKSLLVVVDTHKPSMVINKELLDTATNVVVVDHHRRSEEFVGSPVLVYIEPYASSTAELITELFEYQPDLEQVGKIEATALLSGIVVDTKNFTLRTGSRTFDAASYLRSLGADTILVQQFLKEDITTFTQRSRLVESLEIYHDGMAIATGHEDEEFGTVIAAQAADTMLSMEGVQASFVITLRPDKLIGISARSLGQINVQVIMEKLGGGGHLSNAATQLKDVTITEAEKQLISAIDAYWKGET